MGSLAICPGCLRSVVIDEASVRLATAADTVGLDDLALGRLRAQRKAARTVLEQQGRPVDVKLPEPVPAVINIDPPILAVVETPAPEPAPKKQAAPKRAKRRT